jgi:hypothetical protein
LALSQHKLNGNSPSKTEYKKLVERVSFDKSVKSKTPAKGKPGYYAPPADYFNNASLNKTSVTQASEGIATYSEKRNQKND